MTQSATDSRTAAQNAADGGPDNRTAAQKAADDAADADRKAAERKVAASKTATEAAPRRLIPDPGPNPPAQAAHVPAKQIPGATGDYPAPRQPATRSTAAPLRVVATRMGYYDDKLRREGDVFDIRDLAAFSAAWMAHVDPRTPEKLTGPNAALRQQHDAVVGDRLGPRTDGVIAGRDDVGQVPTGSHNPLGE